MDVSRARTRNPVEWLETAPEFSWPLANQLREWILTWEPDLAESVKWNMLCFSGRKLICGLSACQRHLAITFFRGTELPDPARLFAGGEQNTNIRSVRLTALDCVDRDALRELLHAAVELDADPLIPPAPKIKRAPLPMPDFFRDALAKKQNGVAAKHFHALAPTYQREYIQWLRSAKRPETRGQRLKETLAALKANRKWAQRKV
jgi:hypothetical protein